MTPKLNLLTVKTIEKVKAILMKLHQLNEEQSFQLLRKNAISHRMTIGEMACRLIDAQALLQGQINDAE
jgi:response regulator NasT